MTVLVLYGLTNVKENSMIDFCCGFVSILYQYCQYVFDACHMMLITMANGDEFR